MYGLTRATMTLIGVLAAGLLLWLASQVIEPERDTSPSAGEYWGWLGICAGAGLVLALSQLLGGWTKWGWPRVSGSVFLLGFLPMLLLGGWILAYYDFSESELQERVSDWSDDVGIEGVIADIGGGGFLHLAVIAFLIGLVFGLTFDTTGPRRRAAVVEEPAPVAAGAGYAPGDAERRAAVDEREVAEPEVGAAPARGADDTLGERETRVVPPDRDAEAETRVVRPDTDPDAPPPRRDG